RQIRRNRSTCCRAASSRMPPAKWQRRPVTPPDASSSLAARSQPGARSRVRLQIAENELDRGEHVLRPSRVRVHDRCVAERCEISTAFAVALDPGQPVILIGTRTLNAELSGGGP